jgi:hypothetical protein
MLPRRIASTLIHAVMFPSVAASHIIAKEKQRTDEEQQQLRETVEKDNHSCSEEQLEYLMEFKEALFFSADARELKKPETGGNDKDHEDCEQGRGSVSPTKVISVGDPSRDGPVGNITVSEGLNSGSVVVDAAKNDCLDSVSCGYVSYGRSVATTKLASVVGGPSSDGPVGNITVSEGLDSGSVVVDAAKKDCLDSVSCGYVSYGRSVATTKLASVVGGPSCDGPVGNITVLEGLDSGTVVVDAAKNDCLDSISSGYVSYGCSVAATPKLVSLGNRDYVIETKRKKNYRNFECLMHSINSWKHTAQYKALKSFASGKKVPKYTYAREDRRRFKSDPCKWIICECCQRGICINCAVLVKDKIMVDTAVPQSIKQSDNWCLMVSLFQNTDEPEDDHVSVITIPTSIAHCCRLKIEVKHKCNQLSRIKKKQKKGRNIIHARQFCNKRRIVTLCSVQGGDTAIHSIF